jgi:signal transduction histidine kinase
MRLRDSFAARLVSAAVVLVLAILGGISAFLLIGRVHQATDAALANADNRAAVVAQLLDRLTAATGRDVATQLAQSPPLVAAVSAPDAASRVPALFAAAGAFNPRGQYAVVLDADGRVLFSSLPAGLPQPDGSLPSVVVARSSGRTVSGVEILGRGSRRLAAMDSAAPIVARGQVLGTVVLVAPLADQLRLYQGVVGFPVAFVSVADPVHVARLGGSAGPAVVPAAIADGIRRGAASVHATYTAPQPSGGTETVAGSFVALPAPGGRTAGYVGVEAPLSLFSGDIRSDLVALGLISGFVILGTIALVVVVVVRFVTRPVIRLERGVARIANGDYTSDIEVRSRDELGRLAASVNRMRAQIAAYVRAVEDARARLDRAVEQLAGVSRALTTTTGGAAALDRAVVEAAAAIAGGGAAAVLALRDEDRLVVAASCGVEGGVPDLEPWGVCQPLLAGEAVRAAPAPPGWMAGGMLAVPMFWQQQVVGALAVITRAGRSPDDADAPSLGILANAAAIARENARLFEQERETVRRLRELDAMKSDFLATVQHELRTPLTAILGMSDLLEMCWESWDDAAKLDAIGDIQLAARNLYDIVETMIDFSMLEAETLGLKPEPTSVRCAVDQAVDAVRSRHKGALPVSLELEVPEHLEVFADPDRLRQVIQALLDNAVKFTPEGGQVRIRATADGAAGTVVVDVDDTGIGIPESALERIFDRFYQVDNSATRRYGGAGMGLALVRRLAEAHGATVEVESRLGVGSRFRLRWPAQPATSAGEAREVALAHGQAR